MNEALETQYPPVKFETFSQRVGEIEDQNERLDSVDDLINDPELNTIVTNSIRDEQSSTHEYISNPENWLPLEELFESYDKLNQELVETSERLEVISNEDDARKTALIALTARARKLAPLAHEQIDSIEASRMEHIDNLNRAGLQKRISTIEDDILQLDLLLDIKHVTVWPIPQALDLQREVDSELMVIDEMPVEPELHSINPDLIKRVRGHESHTPKVSEFITYYLAENAGKATPAEELARFIYADTDDLRQVSGRITTLLGPKVHGFRIEAQLEAKGLSLEYGWRKTIDKESGKTKSRIRLYRAVSLETSTANRQPFEEVVAEQDESTHLAKVETVESIEPAQPVFEQPKVVFVAEKLDTQTLEKVEKATEAEWESDFRVKTAKQLDKFMESGLVTDLSEDDTYSLAQIRHRSGSNILGTVTGLDRAGSVGIIKKNQSEFSLEEVLKMALLNSSRRELTNRRYQPLSESIIQEVIAAKIAELELA